jgi:hypothetical protein
MPLPTKPGRPCSICSNAERRKAVDRAILSGEPIAPLHPYCYRSEPLATSGNLSRKPNVGREKPRPWIHEGAIAGMVSTCSVAGGQASTVARL